MPFFDQVCISHIGKRANHEDNFLFGGKYITSPEQKAMTEKRSICRDEKASGKVRFYAISDGMGGHSAGEIASQICVVRLAELEPTVQNCESIKDVVAICQDAISDINNEVCAKSRENSTLKGMGATLVLLVICGSQCAVLNIGDSRAYYFDGSNLSQITKDHTEGQRMLDLNLLTVEELSNFPARRNLNRYIGFNEPGLRLKADEYYIKAQSGSILLCSDGVNDSMTNAEIEKYLRSETDVKVIGKNIIERAVMRDSSDNATAIIIKG